MGSVGIDAQRLDKTGLGSRQQLRKHLQIVARGRLASGQRRIHVDADQVAARREPHLALASEQHVPGLAAIQRVTGLPPCASFLETISFSSSRVGQPSSGTATPLIRVGTHTCSLYLPP